MDAAPPITSTDERFMARAVELAGRGLGLAAPNPMVGAVLVRGDQVVGEGWHEGRGTLHAEIRALGEAGERGRGATLYTTLEPCSHFGRTPPCAPAIVDAGVTRVVAGMRDPNPVVDGRGFAIVRAGGVDVAENVLADRCAALIEGFATYVRTGRPLVTLKMAASLDGRTAARDGSSRWITGGAAREDVHRLRARAGAVLVGAGTVLADDPSLTVRLDGYRGRQPLRVMLDGAGTVPATRAIFTDGRAPTLVVTTERASSTARSSWEGAGAEVLVLDPADGSARVPIAALVEHLGKREIQDVLLEGGPTLAWSAMEARVVDRLVLYLAPKLIGGVNAPGILGGAGVPGVIEALPVDVRSVERIGTDVKVVADVHRDH